MISGWEVIDENKERNGDVMELVYQTLEEEEDGWGEDDDGKTQRTRTPKFKWAK